MRAIPIIAALVSTSILAYFLLSDRSQPFAQSQQEDSQPTKSGAEAADDAERSQSSAQDSGQRFAQNGAQQGQQQAKQQSPAQLLPMPSDDRLLLMIMSSLMALNQANLTGNYTVLRDLAAPGFQKVNSPERLSQLFTKLRGRNIDLTPILLFQPKLYRKPEMNNTGMLRVTGFFPTTPERVNFDLIFQPVQGQWRLFGIGVDTARPQQAQPQGNQGTQPANAGNATAAPPAPKPKPKPKAKKTPPEPEASSDGVGDVRDRIEQPQATPPAAAAEKPKQRGIWNPFGR